MRELLTPDIGRLVPYLDVSGMADAIVELLDDEPLRAQLGAKASEVVTAEHDVTIGAPRLWAEISGEQPTSNIRPDQDAARRRGRFAPVTARTSRAPQLTRDLAVAGAARPPRRWYDVKISAILFVGLALLVLEPADAERARVTFAALVASATLLGAYAHVVDDAFDVVLDARVGKANRLAGLTVPMRVLASAALGVAGLLPWAVVDAGPLALAVLVVIVGLPIAYAAPGLRMKDGTTGIVSDAVMAHVAPAAFTLALVAHRHDIDDGWAVAVTAALLLAWAFARGVRAIGAHQLRDVDDDRASGAGTFAVRRGVEATQALALVAYAGEVATLGALALLGALLSPWITLAAAGYALCWWWARGVWSSIAFVPVPVLHNDPREAMDRFSVVWPPLLTAAWLVTSNPAHLPLAATTVVLLRRTIVEELTAIARYVPSLLRRIRRRRRSSRHLPAAMPSPRPRGQ